MSRPAVPYTGPRGLERLDRTADRERLERLAWLLDDQFRIPGTDWRIGWDAIVSAVPVLGDTAAGLVSVYLVSEARRLGAPKRLIAKMLVNVGLDWAVGMIPLAGIVFDAAFKANRRNIRLLLAHLGRDEPPAPARLTR